MSSRANVIKHVMQRANETAYGMLDKSAVFRAIKFLLSSYMAFAEFMKKLRHLKEGVRPLNETFIEGLYRKRIEIFYFDFFTDEEVSKMKVQLRSLITAIILTLGQYAMCTYFLRMNLINRLLMTCTTATVLIMLLTLSEAARAITLLTLPSMAQGNVKSVMLIGALVLITAGPVMNIRANSNAMTDVQSCVSDQFFSLVVKINSLKTMGTLRLRLLIMSVELAIEVIHRKIFIVYTLTQRLLKYLTRKTRVIRNFVKSFLRYFSFSGGCRRLFLYLQRKYRNTKLLGGFVQGLFKIVSSVTGANLAKPTLGYLAHTYGYSKVCPLLDDVKRYIKEKKQALYDKYIKQTKKKVSKVKAVVKLLVDLTSPKATVRITYTGGMGHQLYFLRRALINAVFEKTKKVKYFQDAATRMVNRVSSALSVFIFIVTIAKAIIFYLQYMARDDFENYYITAPFIRLDQKEPPILPLDDYERSRFAILSEEMISNVAKQIKPRVVIFSLIRIMPLFLILAMEWVIFIGVQTMELITNGIIKVERQSAPTLTISSLVEDGPFTLLAKIFLLVQKSLRELTFNVNLLACSPSPQTPNFPLDFAIAFMCCLYLLLTIFQPFFLKMRHQIMVSVFPLRAVQRAVWLRRRIQAERDLTLDERAQVRRERQEEDKNVIQLVFQQYIADNVESLTEAIRQLFNLPTICCELCGVKGNISVKNFNELFILCDACEQYLCVRCAHCFDEDKGQVKLLNSCPLCHGEINQYDVDAEELAEKDPLNTLLQTYMGLGPEYRVGPKALEQQKRDIEENKRYKLLQQKYSMQTVLSMRSVESDRDHFDQQEGESASYMIGSNSMSPLTVR